MAIGPVQLVVLGFDHPEFRGEIIDEAALALEVYCYRVRQNDYESFRAGRGAGRELSLLRAARSQPMRLLLAGFLLSSTLVPREPVRAIVPAQTPAHPNRFYSPAVDAGDYIYISAQGPRRPDPISQGSCCRDVSRC